MLDWKYSRSQYSANAAGATVDYHVNENHGAWVVCEQHRTPGLPYGRVDTLGSMEAAKKVAQGWEDGF